MTDLDQAKTNSKITRRTVAKGAAWTLPVVSLAAAAPAEAASPPVPPECSTCFKAGKGLPPLNLHTWTIAAVAGQALLTITAGVTSSCGGLLWGFVGLGGATATFREGGSATLPLSPSAGVGLIGNVTSAFVGEGTLLSTGAYWNKTIDTICFPVQFTITIGGKTSTCPKQNLCWKLANGLFNNAPKINILNVGSGPANAI